MMCDIFMLAGWVTHITEAVIHQYKRLLPNSDSDGGSVSGKVDYHGVERIVPEFWLGIGVSRVCLNEDLRI